MFGEEPKMSSYFVTRAGKGISIERTKAYKYQSLASGFMNRTADPFIVTVEPKAIDEPIHYNKHNGQNSTLSSKDVCLSTSKAKKSSSIKETVFILTLNFHMA